MLQNSLVQPKILSFQTNNITSVPKLEGRMLG
jgi:hypothetical protein